MPNSPSSAPFSLSALQSVRTRRPRAAQADGRSSVRRTPGAATSDTSLCTTQGTAGPTGRPCSLLPGGSSPSVSLCLFLSVFVSLHLSPSLSLPPCFSVHSAQQGPFHPRLLMCGHTDSCAFPEFVFSSLQHQSCCRNF